MCHKAISDFLHCTACKSYIEVGVRQLSWTGLCRKSETFLVFDGAECTK